MPQKKMSLITIFAAITIASLGIGIVLPIIPMLIKDASGSQNIFIGLSATIMSLSFSLSSFPLGRWIDKTSPKNSMILGLIVYGFAVFLFPWFHGVTAFLIIRAIEGIGWGGIWMGTETLINQLSSPSNRGRNMGIYGFCISVGMAGGPMIGTFLLDYGIIWPFLICTILSFCCLIFVIAYVPRNTISEHSQNNVKISIWNLRHALVAAFIYGVFEATMMSMFPAYFLSINVSKSSLSMIITSFFVGGILFQIPAGKISDKIGKPKSLVLFAVLLIVVLVLFAHFDSLSMSLILGFLAGALGGAFYPVGLSILPDKLKPEQLGAGNANFTFIYGMGSILGPIVIAFLMDWIDNKAVFYSFIPLCIGLISLSLTKEFFYDRKTK